MYRGARARMLRHGRGWLWAQAQAQARARASLPAPVPRKPGPVPVPAPLPRPPGVRDVTAERGPVGMYAVGYQQAGDDPSVDPLIHPRVRALTGYETGFSCYRVMVDHRQSPRERMNIAHRLLQLNRERERAAAEAAAWGQNRATNTPSGHRHNKRARRTEERQDTTDGTADVSGATVYSGRNSELS